MAAEAAAADRQTDEHTYREREREGGDERENRLTNKNEKKYLGRVLWNLKT